MGLREEVHWGIIPSKEESELLGHPNVKSRAISSRALDGEIPLPEKVQRLSRKGVGRKRVRSTPTQEWADDIVCACRKLQGSPGLTIRISRLCSERR